MLFVDFVAAYIAPVKESDNKELVSGPELAKAWYEAAYTSRAGEAQSKKRKLLSFGWIPAPQLCTLKQGTVSPLCSAWEALGIM